MIEFIKVILLGIIEGVTEFLPISSTGHLIVATALLQPAFTNSVDSTFIVFIQLGAVFAVVLYYSRDLLAQAIALPTNEAVRLFWFHVLMAVVPALVVGLLARDFVKQVLFSPVVVAVTLIFGGIVFIVVERRPPASAPQDDMMQISLRQAIAIGVAQTVAFIPGVSRSAASILGGMAVGLSRSAATRFSFYLAIPTLGGATVLDLLLSLDEVQSSDWGFFIAGAAVAGVVAWLSIGWLLRYVAQNTFTAFGWYRIVAGLIVLGLAVAGIV